MKYIIKDNKLLLYYKNDAEFAKISFKDIKGKVLNTGFQGTICLLIVGGVTVASINTNVLLGQTVKIEDNEHKIEEDTETVNPPLIPIEKFSLEIKEILLPVESKKVGGINNIQYIVVHNTANYASAENEVKYLHSSENTSYTSFHYAVDENEIWQAIDEKYFGYHAGDTYYNENSIGVEIARSIHDDLDIRDEAILNGSKLIAKLLNEHNLSIDKLISHQDASGKFCPHDIYERYGWETFIEEVKYYMNYY